MLNNGAFMFSAAAEIGANSQKALNSTLPTKDEPKTLVPIAVQESSLQNSNNASLPKTGRTTGILGYAVIGEISTIIQKAKTAFKGKSIEAKLIAIQDIINIPLRLLIAIATTINATAPFIQVAAYAAIATVAISVLLIVSSIYITLELLSTIMSTIKSVRFEEKEKLGHVLKVTKKLAKEISKLEEQSAPSQQILRLKRVIAFENTIKLYDLYKYTDDERQQDYLIRRIGIVAVEGFKKAYENMDAYSADAIYKLSEKELEVFNTQTTTLLTMMNHHRKKSLNVHIYSLPVLFIFAVSMLISTKVIPTTDAAYGILASVLSTGTSVWRMLLDDIYVNNTCKGVDFRLFFIFKLLAPKEGEKTLSIERKMNCKWKYTLLSVLSLGLLHVFDKYIYKAQWMKELTSTKNSFNHPEALFKERDFTISHPSKLLDAGFKTQTETMN